jgi:hypothetical protein
MAKFESEQDALEYLAANRGLLAAPVNRILEDPRIESARNPLRAELAVTVQPLIEAKRKAAMARLRWFLWDKLDRDPPPELAGVRLNVDPRPAERADAADKRCRMLLQRLVRSKQTRRFWWRVSFLTF